MNDDAIKVPITEDDINALDWILSLAQVAVDSPWLDDEVTRQHVRKSIAWVDERLDGWKKELSALHRELDQTQPERSIQ